MGANLPTSFLFTLTLLSHLSHSLTATTVVNDLAEWKIPTSIHVGDSLVFNHKHLQKPYIFHNRRAFDHCNFAQATLLNKGNSSYLTWSPSRPGYYYFSTKDKCEEGERVLVRVITPDLSPGFPPLSAPPPTSGGDISSPSPSPAPEASPLEPGEGITPSSSASAVPPPEGRSGIPFISSNPAVPLPTGETDTATIRPLPTPADGNQVVGLGASLRNLMPSASVRMMSLAVVLWM